MKNLVKVVVCACLCVCAMLGGRCSANNLCNIGAVNFYNKFVEAFAVVNQQHKQYWEISKTYTRFDTHREDLDGYRFSYFHKDASSNDKLYAVIDVVSDADGYVETVMLRSVKNRDFHCVIHNLIPMLCFSGLTTEDITQLFTNRSTYCIPRKNKMTLSYPMYQVYSREVEHDVYLLDLSNDNYYIYLLTAVHPLQK